MGILEGEEKENGTESLFKEIINVKFPNGMSWTFKDKKLTEHLIISTQKDLLQDAYENCQKLMTKK